MAGFNKCFLIGRLTADPESRTLASGAVVCDLRLAVNRAYSTKAGERREETLFIDVTTWNALADACAKYLIKGRTVHVSGSLVEERWDDRATGEKRSKVKLVADDVQFLDGGGAGRPAGLSGADFRPSADRGGGARPSPLPGGPPRPPGSGDDEEDIPFAAPADGCPWGGVS